MNEKTKQNDEKNDNNEQFSFNISTDNSKAGASGTNDLKATGAIPKVKPIINGVSSKTKVNNVIKSKNNNVIENGESGSGVCASLQEDAPKINGFFRSEVSGVNTKVNDMGHSFTNGLESVKVNCEEAGPSSNVDIDYASNSPSESDFSSDTGNDELSYCDDYCIYTYKGDIADLPRSFMNLDQENNENGSQAGSRGSSPEMDFLEMDFDPGPSNDIESDNSSLNIDLDEPQDERQDESNNFNLNVKSDHEKKSIGNELNEEPKPDMTTKSNNVSVESNNAISKIPASKSEDFKLKNINEPQPCCSKSESNIYNDNYNKNDLSQLKLSNIKFDYKIFQSSRQNDPWIPKSPQQRTKASSVHQDLFKNIHSSGGDLIYNENMLITVDGHLNSNQGTTEKMYLDKQLSHVESNVESVDKTMIWTEQEAALKQTTQIGTSACAAAAVINVLKALEYEVPTNEKILENVQTRQRANNSPLLPYLQSRSEAGSTHEDIIQGLQQLTDNQIYARFFHTYPERYINLSLWLSHWIKLGAVPIATLNLQKTSGVIADAWHHHMIFGVGPNGIYLTNPLERIDEGILWHQLNSDSELMVRREDIISRFDFSNLREMMAMRDVRWKRLNVVGQVANVVREHRLKSKILSRTHVNIPVSYKAGITLAIDVNNPACETLKTCNELPVYYTTV